MAPDLLQLSEALAAATDLGFHDFETLARDHGCRRVAGLDEAGRGPLAGPVVAAAVLLPANRVVDGLNDSKQLTARARDRLFAELTEADDVVTGVGVVDVPEIDRLNILRATHLALAEALAALSPAADYAFVDGLPVPSLSCPSTALVKGDARCAAIAAASIIAKVHRDRLMVDYDHTHPGYGFAQHKGYGTRAHLQALAERGACPIHRRSFAPVARTLNAARQGELDLD
jgi:ribonuclease HII